MDEFVHMFAFVIVLCMFFMVECVFIERLGGSICHYIQTY